MSKKIKKRKKTLFIAGIIIISVVLAIVVSSIFASEISDKLKGALSNLNPFAQEEAGEGGGAGEGAGEGEGTEEPTTIIVNKSKNETIIAGGSGGGAAAATYGIGKLEIINYVSSLDTVWRTVVVHRPGATEDYGTYDSAYYGLFLDSTENSKIISNITGYELDLDSRPLNSLSTIYLELSLHSQSGGSITLNSTNELRLSLPLAGRGYTFANKTMTLQQYNPNNTAESYPLYNVRDIIDNHAGVIALARLDGTYASEVPYAWFRLSFS